MGLLRTLFSDSLADTRGFCAECAAVVPAATVVHDGAVWLRRECGTHGTSEVLQSRHPGYYRLMEALLPGLREPTLRHALAAAPNVRGIFIDLTEACDLKCPNCLTDAGGVPRRAPPELGATLAALRELLPRRPVLYLTGGEPTLRPDLLSWIRALTTAGYDVKLLSNGRRLADRAYCESLRAAGLRWVLLQFDSLDDRSLAVLRGPGGLAAVRRRAVANLSALGMNLVLACMIHRDVNLDEIAEILRFGFLTPGVRHVSLMPSRRLGRGELTSDQNLLDEIDVMRSLERQTGGAVRPLDWILMQAAAAAAFRLTGIVHLAPRRCFLPLPLLGTADRFFPITRLAPYVRHPGNLVAALALVRGGGHIEVSSWSERALLVSIETFREPGSIDVGDAARCSRYYLVDHELHQACIYNVINRPHEPRPRRAAG
jgi:uncharacterized radical SAM superfamily Fe-S cluster-containing enzyme